ncbi:PAB-dependent poly(A)-specific ribonuclease subunit pan3 [Exophiala aquamarina CBS 119918]|uniref:PAN2-PAN3 deadenylation complex subunit PAN3 n=1 Tax=Exophiala aquamarina CBS 119918 TaxID=1182545 RepID=A0A072PA38_9EURO|nr:PAB-dependent poly(A)-specific ribonuclease subunit pan3 [Exophiala aquamarina CBS 119918]KEF56974.1 PAB-dependent poly(A)-specific ribonuclease subunit pan3 [Exophiala aquamarina CBS 119918]
MAAVIKSSVDDSKNTTLSPRPKGRENAKDTLCRNVTIYGKCRYEDKGCAFNHNVEKSASADGSQSDGQQKKALNVDSPSFTPSFLSPNGANNTTPKKSAGISPKAASAAPFMPKAIISRSSTTTPLRQDARTPDWAMADVQEFVPRRAQDSSMTNENEIPVGHSFETFQPTHAANPYLDHGLNGAAFYQGPSTFQQPVQYHQYAPIGHYSTNLAPYQRTVHDLFIPDDLREEIQKKSAAALQTLPNSQLPNHIESYHSLVPLDTNQKSSTIFGGYTSWVYKAQSSANGHLFALRRIEGFRLTNELAIRSGQAWKHLISASVVRIVDVFTNRGFGDSSLFVVTDYHPLSKTLLEHHHIGHNWARPARNNKDQVSEPVLWSYVVQIASALKVIHSSGLAARVVDPSKILVTSKNRIRLNGCGILDVVQFDNNVPLAQLQRQDLVNFALVILSIGSGTAEAGQNFARSMDLFKRYFKKDLQDALVWLYSAMQNQERTIDQFTSLISNQMITAFNGALHNDDTLHNELSREVENARLVRLLAKLNFITERPEYEHDRAWSENGERYFLKLFRDYVFHQVDAQNRPVLDLGHVLTSLNKLDAGTDEKITLISRDEQSCFVVSYREVKKGVESAFSELLKRGSPPMVR